MELNHINFEFVSMSNNIDDMLTKPLGKTKTQEHCKALRLKTLWLEAYRQGGVLNVRVVWIAYNLHQGAICVIDLQGTLNVKLAN